METTMIIYVYKQSRTMVGKLLRQLQVAAMICVLPFSWDLRSSSGIGHTWS